MRKPPGGRTVKARAAALAWTLASRMVSGATDDWARSRPYDVFWCYRLLLGRPPDDRGYRGFISNVTARRIPVEELVDYFVNSEEFTARLAETFGWSSPALERHELEDGAALFVPAGDTAVGAEVAISGAYERHVTAALLAALQPGDTFVDVGASVGYFSVVAAAKVGSEGRVVAIEPGRQNHSPFLLNAIAADCFHIVRLEPVAVGRNTGLALYRREGSNGSMSSFDPDRARRGMSEVIEVKTLDELLRGYDRISVMKIDVEGAEGAVLAGATSVLDEARPTLLFELSGPALEARSEMTTRDLLTFLKGFGYRFTVLSGASDPRPISLDCLVELDSSTETNHLDVLAVTG